MGDSGGEWGRERVGDSGEERERVGGSGGERERVGDSGEGREWGIVGKKGREWGIVGKKGRETHTSKEASRSRLLALDTSLSGRVTVVEFRPPPLMISRSTVLIVEERSTPSSNESTELTLGNCLAARFSGRLLGTVRV